MTVMPQRDGPKMDQRMPMEPEGDQFDAVRRALEFVFAGDALSPDHLRDLTTLCVLAAQVESENSREVLLDVATLAVQAGMPGRR